MRLEGVSVLKNREILRRVVSYLPFLDNRILACIQLPYDVARLPGYHPGKGQACGNADSQGKGVLDNSANDVPCFRRRGWMPTR